MSLLEKAFQYVDENWGQMKAELAEICSYRSTASDSEGRLKTRQVIERLLEKEGLHPIEHKVEGGNNLLTAGMSGKREDTILFYNHYDVVEAGDPAYWKNEKPFQLLEKEGKLYARGISDNKGPLLSRIHGVRAVKNVMNGILPVSVKFLLEGDEESGSPSMEKFAQEFKDEFSRMVEADVCLWENGRIDGDGNPYIRMGVRGNCSYEMRVKTAAADTHGRMGAVIESASWRLIWALASLKGQDEKIRIEGFYDKILPETEEDRKVLQEFPYDEKKEKKALGISKFLDNASGEELKRRMYMEPSFSVCGLEAGEMYKGPRGIVPHTACARISFYLVADQDPQELTRQLRKHLDDNGFTDIELIPKGAAHRSVRTPVTHPMKKRICDAAKMVYDKPMVVELTQLGAGPACILRNVNPELPIIGIGPGNTHSNHHAPNENLSIEDYKNAVKHIIALLLSYEETEERRA